MNPERLICGLATVFGQRHPGGVVWQARHFGKFVDSGHTVPMWIDHREPVLAGENVGTWVAFAAVGKSSTPAGLLAIGEFANSPAGEGHLEEARSANPWGGEPLWGLSVQAADISDDESGRWWLRELSLTRKPIHDNARVLGVGPYAGDVWRLLTGTEPPVVRSVAATTARRLLGIRGGKPVYEEWTE